MPKASSSVNAYIDALPENVRDIAQQLRTAILAELPDAEERISYGIPAFRWQNRNVVYFGAWKKHLGMYPVYKGDAAFEAKVGVYRSGKDSLHFAFDQPIPVEIVQLVVRAQKEKLSPK